MEVQHLAFEDHAAFGNNAGHHHNTVILCYLGRGKVKPLLLLLKSRIVVGKHCVFITPAPSRLPKARSWFVCVRKDKSILRKKECRIRAKSSHYFPSLLCLVFLEYRPFELYLCLVSTAMLCFSSIFKILKFLFGSQLLHSWYTADWIGMLDSRRDLDIPPELWPIMYWYFSLLSPFMSVQLSLSRCTTFT